MEAEIKQMLQYCPYTFEEITSAKRVRGMVYWRNAIMYHLRDNGYTFQSIGRAFGNRNHATVIHSLKTVETALEGFNKQQLKIYNVSKTKKPIRPLFCNEIIARKITPKRISKKKWKKLK